MVEISISANIQSSDWIRIDEQLPPKGKIVWISDGEKIAFGSWSAPCVVGNVWQTSGGFIPEFRDGIFEAQRYESTTLPTHWLPLPLPPIRSATPSAKQPAESQAGWICTNDQLPIRFKLVWLCEGDYICIGCFAYLMEGGDQQWWVASNICFSNGEYDGDQDVMDITPDHWLPLPVLPT
jgi:hypothetical protein